MNKYIQYKIIPDLKLTIEYFKGQVYLDDIIDFKNIEIKDKKYNPNYNSVGDFRDAELLLDENQIKEFINYVKRYNKNMGVRKSALLTNTPSQVVITTLYQLNSEGLPMSFKIFSTLESAMEWMGISPNDYHKIEKTIQDMKI